MQCNNYKIRCVPGTWKDVVRLLTMAGYIQFARTEQLSDFTTI